MSYAKKLKKPGLILTMGSVTIVMLICLLFFYIDPPSHWSPQYSRLLSACKTCIAAKALAGNDFKNEKYQVIAWGLPDSGSPTIKMAKILERDYKIKTHFGGCMRIAEIECYDAEMRKLLVFKYGNTFYKTAYAEAIKGLPKD
jgi:hypothetical protein